MASSFFLSGCLLLFTSVTSVCGQFIFCYDCNSGGLDWDNPNCPANGEIQADRVSVTECPELCFVRTHIWNPGAIYRGCSAGFWLPRPLPTNGCMIDSRGDNWCFCNGDECNTTPMTPYRK